MIARSLETNAMKGEFLLNVMMVIFLIAATASPVLQLAFAFGWLKY
jgi:hypothetical protein